MIPETTDIMTQQSILQDLEKQKTNRAVKNDGKRRKKDTCGNFDDFAK